MPLQNRYKARDPEGQADDTKENTVSGGSTSCAYAVRWITTSAIQKKGRVVVVGGSLLRRDPVCCLDLPHREVCCLPEAQVQDITRRLPELIEPSDYYPLLVVQVCSNEVDRKDTRAVLKDFMALGRLVHGTGVQVMFCSVPSVAGMNGERNRRAHIINKWLKSWCH